MELFPDSDSCYARISFSHEASGSNVDPGSPAGVSFPTSYLDYVLPVDLGQGHPMQTDFPHLKSRGREVVHSFMYSFIHATYISCALMMCRAFFLASNEIECLN